MVVGPPTPAGTPPPVAPVDLPSILIVGRPSGGRRLPRTGVVVHRAITPADHVSIPRPRPTSPVVVVVRGRRPQPPVQARPARLDAPPPPPPPPVDQYPQKAVVVQTMGIRYQLGARRRKVQVYTSASPTGGGVVSAAARSRVTIVQRPPARKPSYKNLGVSTRTVRPTGVPTPPPPIGAGGSPKPLQPNWIGVNRSHSPKPIVKAIVVRTRFVPPTKDGLTNQVVVVAPQRRRRPTPAVIVNPKFKWGLNAGKTPNPPVVVDATLRRRVSPPIVVHSPAVRGLGFVPPRRPLMAPRPARGRRLKGIVTILPADMTEFAPPPTLIPVVVPPGSPRRVRAPLVLHSPYDSTRQVRPRSNAPTVVPRPVRGRRLRGLVLVLPVDAGEIAPQSVAQPLVVPSRLKGAKALRSPIVVATKPTISYRKIPVFDPLVVPRIHGRKAAPWVFTSQFLQFTVPPPRHDPMPRTLFVRVPRRRVPLMWPQPQFAMSIRQPDDQRYDKPWDLIAACIAWLRTKPSIVAEFGDAKGTPTGEKFVSDVALLRTDPPYVVFSEPREVEDYETPDQTGRRSSRVTGAFLIEILAAEKLDARQKADRVAAALQDAPLEFSDGVLMYLRRSERAFPSFKATGPGGQVTMYKRIVEFNYMIERFF